MYEETGISCKFMGDKPCLHQCHRVGDGRKVAEERVGSFVSLCLVSTIQKSVFLNVSTLFQNIR